MPLVGQDMILRRTHFVNLIRNTYFYLTFLKQNTKVFFMYYLNGNDVFVGMAAW